MLEYGQCHTNYVSISEKTQTQLLLLETNNPKSYALIGAKIKL